MSRVSAGERKAVMESGNPNWIHDLKQGDIYAEKHKHVQEASTHRALQEKLYKAGYDKNSSGSREAYGWNSALIHNDTYATNGFMMGYTFEQLFVPSKTKPYHYDTSIDLNYSNMPYLSRTKNIPSSSTIKSKDFFSSAQTSYYPQNEYNKALYKPMTTNNLSCYTIMHKMASLPEWAFHSLSEPKDIDMNDLNL